MKFRISDPHPPSYPGVQGHNMAEWGEPTLRPWPLLFSSRLLHPPAPRWASPHAHGHLSLDIQVPSKERPLHLRVCTLEVWSIPRGTHLCMRLQRPWRGWGAQGPLNPTLGPQVPREQSRGAGFQVVPFLAHRFLVSWKWLLLEEDQGRGPSCLHLNKHGTVGGGPEPNALCHPQP